MKHYSRFDLWSEYWRLLRDMGRGEPIPFEFYQRIQLRRLRSLVEDAFQNVDYYRMRFNEIGIKPESIQKPEDIASLPFLSKDELRANFPTNILARNVSRRHLTELTTTGHTGLPVRFYRDKRQLRSSTAGLILASRFLPRIVKAWTGLDSGNKLAVMFPEDNEYDISIIVKQALRWPRLLSHFLQWIDTSRSPYEQVSALAEGRPDILLSDPNTLCNMVMVARRKRLALHKPKLLVITSEAMDEYSREIVTQGFCKDYIEHYGAEEVGTIGYSCLQHSGFHILMPAVVVEILQDGRPVPPGNSGDIVVTDLTNKISPIMRYTGLKDAGLVSAIPCSCGSQLPLLRLTETRVRDSFVLPNLSIIHPRAVVAALKCIPGLADYQVVQEKRDRVDVQLVAQKGTGEQSDLEGNLCSIATKKLTGLFGDGVKVRVELVQSIPVPAGRLAHPNVVSLVPRCYF